jgi:hypothetical protein
MYGDPMTAVGILGKGGCMVIGIFPIGVEGVR